MSKNCCTFAAAKEKCREMKEVDKLTAEYLKTIRLPLSEEDYQMLRKHEDEFFLLTRGAKQGTFFHDLEMNYLNKWENKRLGDPNLDPTVAYGDL